MNPNWWRIGAVGLGLGLLVTWFFWPSLDGPEAEEFVGTWTARGLADIQASLLLTSDGRFEMSEMPASLIAPLETDHGSTLAYSGWGYWRTAQSDYWAIVFDIEDGPPVHMDTMTAFVWREGAEYRLCFPHGQNQNSAECALFERQQ
ncbi:MAG: hypothetical protein HN348_12825 [Proteobacteria bacterium]|nr:hypothetical protein [Pseudomonadota bacterium]